MPADIVDTFPSSYLNRAYFWPDLEASRMAGEMPRRFPQARVMGGGSTVMGLWALRGLPRDYESWAAGGADGWGWSDVARCFRKLEDDMDVDAGRILEGRATLDEVGREVYALTLAVARGAATKSEALGHQEFILTYKAFDHTNEPAGPACLPVAA